MAPFKMNVLVYTGPGASSESVKHCLFSLRQLLTPTYAVHPIGENALLKEPWAATCALLVLPGGADLGYCRVLNGAGNRSIARYVRAGGRYLGFCAGGYYGSARCEFEVGHKPMEVVGSRELAFFPGTCRGGAFKGFEYQSERGARVARLAVAKGAFEGGDGLPAQLRVYHNGGGVFVDAAKLGAEGVRVLASYEDQLDVDGGDGKAAIVSCSVGKGTALLTGPHIEFAAGSLVPQPDIPSYGDLLRALIEDNKLRESLLRACLSSLGLKVNEAAQPLPPLSSLHLTSLYPEQTAELVSAWHQISVKDGGKDLIRGGSDTFTIKRAEAPTPPDTKENNVFTGDVTAILQELLLGTHHHPALLKAATHIDGNHETTQEHDYFLHFLEQVTTKLGADAPKGLLSAEGTRHIAHILTKVVADPKLKDHLDAADPKKADSASSPSDLELTIRQITADLGMVDLDPTTTTTTTKNGHGRKPSVNGRQAADDGNKIIDYSAVDWDVIVHEHNLPSRDLVPHFNHDAYYNALEHYRHARDPKAQDWGDTLMYGECVTSTNTVLEKNHNLLSTLPSGFTLVARTQVAARGRGTNVWIAPPGQMIFSSVVNHPHDVAAIRPIAFIQHLMSIAVCEGIRYLRPGLEDIPIRIKWPNDIYIRDPRSTSTGLDAYVKICGMLCNCSYSNGNYQVVMGIGVNAVNDRPTTAIKSFLVAGDRGGGGEPDCETLIEEMVASILCRLEVLYKEFLRKGFTEDLEQRYYQYWLHSEQIVTLEAEGGVRARIKGITRDWGMLKAEELGMDDVPTGKVWALQSDENSFDFLRGLVRRKL